MLPVLEAEYRQLTSLGAFDIHGYLTYGSLLQLDPLAQGTGNEEKAIRGYIEASGRLILSPTWTITASGRYATDRTFMRRYDISHDDRLRSVVDAERIDVDSYISIAGWAFEGLRLTDVVGHAADRPARDRRALPHRRPDLRRPDRAPGEQPRALPARRPGHAARLRQRDLGASQHHAASARS